MGLASQKDIYNIALTGNYNTIGVFMTVHQQKSYDVCYFSHFACQSESKNTWVHSKLLFPALRTSPTHQRIIGILPKYRASESFARPTCYKNLLDQKRVNYTMETFKTQFRVLSLFKSERSFFSYIYLGKVSRYIFDCECSTRGISFSVSMLELVQSGP